MQSQDDPSRAWAVVTIGNNYADEIQETLGPSRSRHDPVLSPSPHDRSSASLAENPMPRAGAIDLSPLQSTFRDLPLV